MTNKQITVLLASLATLIGSYFAAVEKARFVRMEDGKSKLVIIFR